MVNAHSKRFAKGVNKMLNQRTINPTDMSFQPNTIYCGDNKDVLRHFPENCVDLIYLDPPFFTNEEYEIIWNDGYERRAFEDRWKGGINNYIVWMDERLRECYRVLKDIGSIYLHCDYHANAHLRILMDKIFVNNFRSEIIWSTETVSGFKSQANKWIRSHDTILFYTKSDKYTFNKEYLPHKEEYIARFKKTDKRGRRFRDDRSGGRKQYLEETKGRLVGDVWNDIMSFQQASTIKEYLGYPTQKPEALLERIINASSNPIDIVLDPFCGCGTAIAVAHKLGRRWIGIDVSPTACKLMEKRMRLIGAREFRVIGLPQTIEDLKKLQPFEFQNWVMEKLYARVNPKKVGDMGIDGYYLDGTPIQVKQSEDVGRNVVDNYETAIKRMDRDKGVIVAFSFGKGAYEEVARAKLKAGLEITLKTVKEILEET